MLLPASVSAARSLRVFVPSLNERLCAEWEAGGIGVTKWAIRSNHGGGYQFRLCKRKDITESRICFFGRSQ